MNTTINKDYREKATDILMKYTSVDLEFIEECHNEEHRYFHTCDHLNSIFKLLIKKKHLTDFEMDVLWLVTLFHDIIYIPYSTTNEEDSKALLLESVNIIDEITIKSCELILDTKFHKNGSKLASIFNSFDMNIIFRGTSDELLDWEDDIRKEYRIYCDEDYKKGRIEFLSKWTHFNENLKELLKVVEYCY